MGQKVIVEATIYENGTKIFNTDFIDDINIKHNFETMLNVVEAFFIMKKGVIPKFLVDDYDEGTNLALITEQKTGSEICIWIKEIIIL
jgi:hypothetical protein